MSKPTRDYYSVKHELDVRFALQLFHWAGYYAGVSLIFLAPIMAIALFACNPKTWYHPPFQESRQVSTGVSPKQGGVIDEGWEKDNRPIVRENREDGF